MPHRILLADDSLTIQKVIELTFSGTDFELKAVGNGDQALALLDSFSPDIVLADCVMPGRSGYELCEEVKRRPGGRFVPVVLLTGTFEPFDKPRAEHAGADSIVTKPFDSQGLASLVRNLVTKAAEERAAAPPEPPPAPEPLPPPPPSPPQPPPIEESIEPPPFEPTPFSTDRMAVVPAPPAPLEGNFYTTSAISMSWENEAPPPPPPAALEPPTEPPPDLPTEPIAFAAELPAPEASAAPPDLPTEPIAFAAELPAPEASVPAYEMDLGEGEDEPPRRDLEEDIAAFEASGRSATRPDLWDSPAVKAAEAASPGEHGHGDLEALAAEARLSDLRSLIPQGSASSAAAGGLSDDDIDRIARRVLELSGERIVRKIAWDVVPELAERLVKERLDELDSAE
jgi:CheY-like chemotaxis protein